MKIMEHNTTPIKSDFVFEDAAGDMGMYWKNVCLSENAMAEHLRGLTKGSCIVSAVDPNMGWSLVEKDGFLVLYFGKISYDGEGYFLHNATSRFDFDLMWADVDGADLEAYSTAADASLMSAQVIHVDMVMDEDEHPLSITLN
ncbi:MAG: hypothetical protein ACYCZR_11875 [Burkholderiales bacterium]